MADFSLFVTNAGLSMITDTAFSGTIIFTRILLGSGNTSEPPQSMSSLVQEEVSLLMSSISKDDNKVTLKTVLQPGDVSETFTWREVGIMAKGSESGVETLYAYANSGSQGDIIPGPGSGTVEERVLEFDVIVGNAESVVAEFQSGVYASKEDLDKIQTNVTNITNIIQQVTGVDPDDPDAEPPSGSMVVTLTHSKSGTVHRFTGLEERTGLVPCQFKSTSGYTEGDTATIDGIPYTITLTGADAPETDLFVSGKSIIVDVDTESKTINFKAGGGLTKAKLALADATEDTVFNGRTFYAGSKTMRTGRALATATNVTAQKMFAGTTAYNQQGQLITGNPASTNVTAAKMFTGTTAFDRNGNLITGNPNASTAQKKDVKSGVTYYDNYGNLNTGERSEDPIELLSGSITLPGTGTTDDDYTTTINPPAGWVYVAFTTITAGAEVYFGSISKRNTNESSNRGFSGRLQIYWSSNAILGYIYWNGSSVSIVKYGRLYGSEQLNYKFYGFE